MPGGRFSKQAPWIAPLANINANNQFDAVIGGTINTVPGNIAGQGFQTLPGDRIIMSPSDALAYANTSVAVLYTGTFRYVSMRNNSTANPSRGRAAFWDLTAAGTGANISSNAADKLYQVTADGNTANITNLMMAGVFINNITLPTNVSNCYWWIQESGKMFAKFIATITGTAAIGMGVYLPLTAPANNNATDNGAFDAFAGANIGTGPIAAANFYATFDGLLTHFVGVAETLPSNNNLSLIDIMFWRSGWRW